MGKAEVPDLYLGESSASHWGTRALQLVLGLFTPLALVSIGGLGIYSGGVLLPLLWLAARAGRGFVRWYLTTLAALVAGEVTWAVAWVFVPDAQLVIPLLAIALTMIGFGISFRRALGASTVVVILVTFVALGASGALALAADPGVQRQRSTFEPG